MAAVTLWDNTGTSQSTYEVWFFGTPNREQLRGSSYSPGRWRHRRGTSKVPENNERHWAMSWAWDQNPGTRAEKLRLWELHYGGRLPILELQSQRRGTLSPGAPRRPCYRGRRS